jgi:hypothetical protein
MCRRRNLALVLESSRRVLRVCERDSATDAGLGALEIPPN